MAFCRFDGFIWIYFVLFVLLHLYSFEVQYTECQCYTWLVELILLPNISYLPNTLRSHVATNSANLCAPPCGLWLSQFAIDARQTKCVTFCRKYITLSITNFDVQRKTANTEYCLKMHNTSSITSLSYLHCSQINQFCNVL